MTWIIIILLGAIIGGLWDIGQKLGNIHRTLIRASDLNLAAHNRLREHFEDLEREKNRQTYDDWNQAR